MGLLEGVGGVGRVVDVGRLEGFSSSDMLRMMFPTKHCHQGKCNGTHTASTHNTVDEGFYKHFKGVYIRVKIWLPEISLVIIVMRLQLNLVIGH